MKRKIEKIKNPFSLNVSPANCRQGPGEKIMDWRVECVMSGVGPPFLKMCLSCFFCCCWNQKKSVCLLDISFHILTEKMNDKRSDDRNLVSFLFFFFKSPFLDLSFTLKKLSLRSRKLSADQTVFSTNFNTIPSL